MLNFLDLFKRKIFHSQPSADKAVLTRKYEVFKSLLRGNNIALELITDLEQILYGVKPFTLEKVISLVEVLEWQCYDIAEDLNALSGDKYPGLYESVERAGVAALAGLAKKRRREKTALTMPLRSLCADSALEAGGKAANLGEVKNRVHLSVPRGFAVTAYACQHFMEANRLFEKAAQLLKDLDIEDTVALEERTLMVREMIAAAPLPPDLAAAIAGGTSELALEFGPNVRLAMRSSATSEDGEASFAGQHSSVLNVRPDTALAAYKEVAASIYTPRAVYYRRSRGYPDEDVIMGVLCLVMVDAHASGVMYTRDPNDASRDVILINSVFGLGAGVVDGSAATDFFEVDKEGLDILTATAAAKPTRVGTSDAGGLVEIPLEDARGRALSLGPERVAALASYGLAIEEHYGRPMDIEWALDPLGRLIILQARPLSLEMAAPSRDAAGLDVDALARELPDNPLLLRGGATASRGKAAGPAYVLPSEQHLSGIPEGVILIAAQTSPSLVSVLGRVRAIVTEVGSVTGHMASVAREFGVPALVGVEHATRVLENGREITVDATNRAVFAGRVDKILTRAKPVNPMRGSPTYTAAHKSLKKIAPLHLVDPKDANFTPEGCTTLHDVIRFAHEMSMREMFSLSDRVGVDRSFAVRLKAPLPMEILMVDLGGALELPAGAKLAAAGDVRSRPLTALLRGMTHPGVRWIGAVGMDWKGFGSILMQSAVADPSQEDRMGGPSYVLASGEYLNFNSRLGYHFAVVDGFCGPRVNDNYVSFSFKGGAADIGRRSRRAELIGKILRRLGFAIEIKGDMTRGRLGKHPAEVIEEKLDMVGRLLGSVRLLDMVLADAGLIDWYVEQFFLGNYTFERGGPDAAPAPAGEDRQCA